VTVFIINLNICKLKTNNLLWCVFTFYQDENKTTEAVVDLFLFVGSCTAPQNRLTALKRIICHPKRISPSIGFNHPWATGY